MERSSRIFVAGHRGLVGSAIRRGLSRAAIQISCCARTLNSTWPIATPCALSLQQNKPEYVFLAAAKVGGILANDTYPADFIRENLEIQTNVIDASYKNGVQSAAVSWFKLHLSQARAPADQRRIFADRAAGADQPRLCAGQNRRHGDVLVLQPAIRHALSRGHANQSLRPRR